MIDSHCHLNFPSIKSDIKNVLKRSEASGVTKLLTINTNPNEFDDHFNLIKEYENIYIAYGIHPEEVKDNSYLSLDDMEDKIKSSRVIGIGETGLDFYHSIEFKKKQYDIFESHIAASKEFDLQIIIHQRNSEKEII